MEGDGPTELADAVHGVIQVLALGGLVAKEATLPAPSAPAPSRRHLGPDIRQASVETIMVVVGAPAVRASPEGTPGLEGLLGDAVPRIRGVPFPAVGEAATDGASEPPAIKAVPPARRQAPGLVLVRPVKALVPETGRAPVARAVTDQATVGPTPLPVIIIPTQEARTSVPTGVPRALPRGVQAVAGTAGRSVRTSNGELPRLLKARDVAPPTEASTEAIPASAKVQGPVGRRRTVLGLAPLPGVPIPGVLTAPGPLIMPRPMTVGAP